MVQVYLNHPLSQTCVYVHIYLHHFMSCFTIFNLMMESFLWLFNIVPLLIFITKINFLIFIARVPICVVVFDGLNAGYQYLCHAVCRFLIIQIENCNFVMLRDTRYILSSTMSKCRFVVVYGVYGWLWIFFLGRRLMLSDGRHFCYTAFSKIRFQAKSNKRANAATLS